MAYQILQKKTDLKTRNAGQQQGDSEDQQSGSVLGGIGDLIGGIFGTNRKRGERLTTGQKVAREVTRSVTSRIGGAVAGGLGKKIGGSMGNTIGRAICGERSAEFSAANPCPKAVNRTQFARGCNFMPC